MRLTKLLSVSALALLGFAGAAQADSYRYDDDYYRDDRYGQTIRCESRDNRYEYCRVDTYGGVSLVNRRSNASCVEGRDWGYDRSGVWVRNGCRADFALGRGYGRDRGDYRDYDRNRDRYERPFTVRCDSYSGRASYCGFEQRYDSRSRHGRGYDRGDFRVRMIDQYSRSSCFRGRDWDVDSRGIWVRNGCRALFEVSPRYRNNYGRGW